MKTPDLGKNEQKKDWSEIKFFNNEKKFSAEQIKETLVKVLEELEDFLEIKKIGDINLVKNNITFEVDTAGNRIKCSIDVGFPKSKVLFSAKKDTPHIRILFMQNEIEKLFSYDNI